MSKEPGHGQSEETIPLHGLEQAGVGTMNRMNSLKLGAYSLRLAFRPPSSRVDLSHDRRPKWSRVGLRLVFGSLCWLALPSNSFAIPPYTCSQGKPQDPIMLGEPQGDLAKLQTMLATLDEMGEWLRSSSHRACEEQFSEAVRQWGAERSAQASLDRYARAIRSNEDLTAHYRGELQLAQAREAGSVPASPVPQSTSSYQSTTRSSDDAAQQRCQDQYRTRITQARNDTRKCQQDTWSQPAMMPTCMELQGKENQLERNSRDCRSSPASALSLLASDTSRYQGIPAGLDRKTASTSAANAQFVPQLLHDFRLNAADGLAEVCVWDHECEDGDILGVSINGQYYQTELMNAKNCRRVRLHEGANPIHIVAVNGTGHKGNCSFEDANTGTISVSSVSSSDQSSQTYSIRGGQGSTANIVVYK